MLQAMRSTVRIDDDLMTAIKAEAERRQISVTRALNRALRAGMQVLRQGSDQPQAPFRQRTSRMGRAAFELTKALQLSTALEDEEVRREISQRK